MNGSVEHLLASMNIHPILVDIGASGAPPPIWDRLAPYSTYVGFDPDERELREMRQGPFGKAVIVNEAATSEDQDEVSFYLTSSPFCSSTLMPNHASLADYLFSDLFAVERQTRVPATSLDAVVERLSLPCIDWFKTDSQGTDLRLFNSLSSDTRSRVLALDIEPGLIDAYVGEDLFVDAHRDLVRQGYWLSDVNICGSVRMQRDSLRAAFSRDWGIDERAINRSVKTSPGWCEARYLRTLGWMAQGDFTERDYALLWVFSILDGQFGFVVDLSLEYERVFGNGHISRFLQSESVLLVKQADRKFRYSPANLARRAMRRLKVAAGGVRK